MKEHGFTGVEIFVVLAIAAMVSGTFIMRETSEEGEYRKVEICLICAKLEESKDKQTETNQVGEIIEIDILEVEK